MADIRKLSAEDIDEMLALDQFAFQFEIADADMMEARSDSSPHEFFGSFVDGKLAAKLGLLSLTSYVNSQSVQVGGICGVATWPEYRRGGLVADLLRHALRVMKNDGQIVSYLAPFSFAFYRRYGFEHCIDRKQYILEKADWPAFEATDGRVDRTDDWKRAAPIYEAYAERFSGTLQRSEPWWQNRVKRSKPGTIAVYSNPLGNPTGYIIYKVKSSELTVYEFVFLDEEARKGLWAFIRNHDSMAGKANLIVPVDDQLPFLLSNPRIKQEIVPHFMARVVDVETFFSQYRFTPQSSNLRLHVAVTDPHAPWNEGDFGIQLRAAADMPAHVARAMAGASEGSAPGNRVACDIQTLTAMMFGYQRPSALAGVGRLQGSDAAVAAWEQAIPRQTTFLYDSF